MPGAWQLGDKFEILIARPRCRPGKTVKAVLIVQNGPDPGHRQILVKIPACQKREHTVVDNAVEVDHRRPEDQAKNARVEGSQPGSWRNVPLHGFSCS